MRLQFIRHENHRIGIALLFQKENKLLGVVEVPKPGEENSQPENFSRICDACTVNGAMVFCRSHSLYLCEFCLSLHNVSDSKKRPFFCDFLSMTAAREMILQNIRHEAHT